MKRFWTLTGLLALGTAFLVLLVFLAFVTLGAVTSFLADRGITLDEDFCSTRPDVPQDAEGYVAVRSNHFPWGWECRYRLEDGTIITLPQKVRREDAN